MSNKAFQIAAKIRKAEMFNNPGVCADDIDETTGKNIIAELKRRRTADCVVAHVHHDIQRRGSTSRTSEVEVIGHAWRAEHGFGKPFHSGGGGRSRMARERADAAKRRAMRKQALKGKISGGIRKAIAGVKRIVRKAARGQ